MEGTSARSSIPRVAGDEAEPSHQGSVVKNASLESSSSSDSFATASNPYEIYQRIKIIEAREYYNVPPQNNQGYYERLVREHLSRARALGDALLLGTVCSPFKPEGKPPGVFIFAARTVFRWAAEPSPPHPVTASGLGDCL